MNTKHIRMLGLIVAAGILINLSGCATIVKGSSQSVTVSTDPSGAACTLSREGGTIAVVNPTPGTIMIEKDKDAISVICKKEGFQDNAGTLASEFQGMTFGNIIFGGIIGVAIDAGSGAMNQYPPMVTITMVPASFDTLSERDTFYARMKTNFESEADEVMRRIKKTCLESNCESQMAAARAARTSGLAEIERKRQLAIYRKM